jgi:predicted nucleic acid-binding protein
MLVVDANIVLEVLYKRSRWAEAKNFLDRIKKGELSVCMLHFAIHGISAMLSKPDLVSTFLKEVSKWRGLEIRDLTVEEEILAAELAGKVGLDFDDGLHYYLAKKMGAAIVSFDRDFDNLDVRRLEPRDIE